MADKVKVLMLCGPTASGKTALAVMLAKALDGEVISADSMQIYSGLTVGTAAPQPEEMQGIAHHLIGVIPPQQSFSVADWTAAAAEKIADIHRRGKIPIIAGGTGLYLSSLMNGVRFQEEKTDPALREKLREELGREGAEAMHARLMAVDAPYAQTLHPNNTGRVLRALEVYLQTGQTMTERLADSLMPEKPYDVCLYGLNYDSRTELYEKIERRVDIMMEKGILDEARLVYKNGECWHTAAQAIGYKEFFPFFEGTMPLELCVDELKKATRHYAKRQLTWFRRMEGIVWERAADPQAAQRIAQAFLQKALPKADEALI